MANASVCTIVSVFPFPVRPALRKMYMSLPAAPDAGTIRRSTGVGAALQLRRGLFHIPLGMGAIALLKMLVIKKIGTFGFYKAAESYGWDRLYRRLLKFNRIATPRATQPLVQAGIRTAIKFPPQAYGVFQETHMYKFAVDVSQSGKALLPGWAINLAESIAGKTDTYKAMKLLERAGKAGPADETAGEYRDALSKFDREEIDGLLAELERRRDTNITEFEQAQKPPP